MPTALFVGFSGPVCVDALLCDTKRPRASLCSLSPAEYASVFGVLGSWFFVEFVESWFPLSEVLVPFIRVPKCKVLVPFIRVPKCLAKFLYPFIRLRLFCGRCVDYRVINPLSSPDGWVDASEWIAMIMII